MDSSTGSAMIYHAAKKMLMLALLRPHPDGEDGMALSLLGLARRGRSGAASLHKLPKFRQNH